MQNNCPECGGNLKRKGKRNQCEHCTFYEPVETSKDRLVRAGFMDRFIVPTDYAARMQSAIEMKREFFQSNKYNTKGELK